MTTNRLNLVTGACGFSGSHVVKELLDKGERVLATDLPKAFEHPKLQFIRSRTGVTFDHPNCQVIPSNLLKAESLRPLFERGVTRVFHTASLYDYSADLEVLRRVNVDGSRNLFEEAVRVDLERFVHWSTCGIFGKPYTAKDGAKCNTPFTEQSSSPKNTPFGQREPTGTNLVNDYSVTKWEQEQIAWKYHREQGLPLTVIRPAPIYGPGSDYGHGGIIISINQGLVPFVPRDTRNYITTSVHVEDLARFAAFVADYEPALGDDYNVVDDSVISYYEFTRYLCLLLGRKVRDLPFVNLKRARPIMAGVAHLARFLERRFGIAHPRMLEVGSAAYLSSSYWIANTKSRKTGFRYKYPDAREGMRETVTWFRDMGWLDPAYNPKSTWQDTAGDAGPWLPPPTKKTFGGRLKGLVGVNGSN